MDTFSALSGCLARLVLESSSDVLGPREVEPGQESKAYERCPPVVPERKAAGITRRSVKLRLRLHWLPAHLATFCSGGSFAYLSALAQIGMRDLEAGKSLRRSQWMARALGKG